MSHPVDVEAKDAPSALPLEGGRITCLTCHDDTAARGHEGRARKGESFLRDREEASLLCVRCHTQSRTADHATSYGKAHVKAPSNGDDESGACLACHDGTVASDAGSHSKRVGLPQVSEHPVGMRFSNKPGSEAVLVPAARLDQRVRLFDGKLGCGTCHSVYAPGENKLVVDNRGSALCLKCHVE